MEAGKDSRHLAEDLEDPEDRVGPVVLASSFHPHRISRLVHKGLPCLL
ncbi:hypothetical protein HFA01_12810 [Halobacillus faecis]|uniref:Uncharacterized protein n=1 Tax=Halobacillus faecis TaxID=360184 RepID=A0A511WPF3_9BACI|nr:hypothetical protein HFA01_12810 [Halobacillus faecis]